jgi:hypothetical protein
VERLYEMFGTEVKRIGKVVKGSSFMKKLIAFEAHFVIKQKI